MSSTTRNSSNSILKGFKGLVHAVRAVPRYRTRRRARAAHLASRDRLSTAPQADDCTGPLARRPYHREAWRLAPCRLSGGAGAHCFRPNSTTLLAKLEQRDRRIGLPR